MSLIVAAAPMPLAASETPQPQIVATAPFLVIAHPSASVRQISRSALSNLFLKRRLNWAGGQKAVPVDLPLTSPLRSVFSERVHKKKVRSVKAFWEQRIFSGSGTPPHVRNSSLETLKFVRSTPGAVGYVSATTDVSGVLVLEVTN